MSKPTGSYAEFFGEVIERAKAHGYKEITLQVSWGNNPTERLYWKAAEEEILDVKEIVRANQ